MFGVRRAAKAAARAEALATEATRQRQALQEWNEEMRQYREKVAAEEADYQARVQREHEVAYQESVQAEARRQLDVQQATRELEFAEQVEQTWAVVAATEDAAADGQ